MDINVFVHVSYVGQVWIIFQQSEMKIHLSKNFPHHGFCQDWLLLHSV